MGLGTGRRGGWACKARRLFAARGVRKYTLSNAGALHCLAELLEGEEEAIVHDLAAGRRTCPADVSMGSPQLGRLAISRAVRQCTRDDRAAEGPPSSAPSSAPTVAAPSSRLSSASGASPAVGVAISRRMRELVELDLRPSLPRWRADPTCSKAAPVLRRRRRSCTPSAQKLDNRKAGCYLRHASASCERSDIWSLPW